VFASTYWLLGFNHAQETFIETPEQNKKIVCHITLIISSKYFKDKTKVLKTIVLKKILTDENRHLSRILKIVGVCKYLLIVRI
jgi:hypothetical protein